MLLTNDGYSLVYYKNRNQIVIGLPQTWKTLTNTLEPVSDRRTDLEEKDLAVLLTVTQVIFLNGISTCGEDLVDQSPTVEPVKHGHWINHFDDLFPADSSVECSVCHEYEGIMANDNYCPNCGAKMDEETTNE